jgi:hypothetical protein
LATVNQVARALADLAGRAAVLVLFAHDHDFENKVARVVWATLPLVAWSAWFYGRLARPWSLGRHSYRVVTIASE